MVALSGCGPDGKQVELKQQSYNSLSECQDDWGDIKNCSPVDDGGNRGSGGSGGSGGYRGPRYYWDREIGRPIVVDANGEGHPVSGTRISGSSGSTGTNSSFAGAHISRGGFGSFGHGFSMGG